MQGLPDARSLLSIVALGCHLLSPVVTLGRQPALADADDDARHSRVVHACHGGGPEVSRNKRLPLPRRFLTASIEEVSEHSGIGRPFLGLNVLPISGNACEHITAVFVAAKDKMDLAIGVALGSSIQVGFRV